MKNILFLLLAATIALAGCKSSQKQEAADNTNQDQQAEVTENEPAKTGGAPFDTKNNEGSLGIEDIVVGQGAEAKNGDTLVVDYVGMLPDGTKFDSSKDHGQTFSFVLGQGRVIAGWDLGLVGMKEGGKRKLTIPPNLGYGTQGVGDVIPPNSTLIFEIELHEIQ